MALSQVFAVVRSQDQGRALEQTLHVEDLDQLPEYPILNLDPCCVLAPEEVPVMHVQIVDIEEEPITWPFRQRLSDGAVYMLACPRQRVQTSTLLVEFATGNDAHFRPLLEALVVASRAEEQRVSRHPDRPVAGFCEILGEGFE